MVVIGVRRTKKRDEPVATFFADAVTAHGGTHGDQGRLEPRNRRLGIQFRDQVSGALQIGTEDGDRSPAMRPQPSATCGFAGCSGTTAPHDAQYKSTAFRVDRQT